MLRRPHVPQPRLLTSVLLVVAMANCSRLALEDAPCPCTVGWKCCQGKCVEEARACGTNLQPSEAGPTGQQPGDARSAGQPTGDADPAVQVSADGGSGQQPSRDGALPKGDSEPRPVTPECANDENCTSSALPACDPVAQKCVECLADKHCMSTFFPYCHNKDCVECLNHDHCNGPERPYCSASKRCVECHSHADCKDASEPFCEDNHFCMDCLDDSHCTDPATPYCHDDGNLGCVECETNDDCRRPGFPGCKAILGTCEECTENVHCRGHPDGEYCTNFDNCGCSFASHCAEHPRGHACVSELKAEYIDKFCGCESTADCPAGKTCHLATQLCE
jgi:hypothetical protein